MAMAASPRSPKIALLRNNSSMARFHPEAIRRNRYQRNNLVRSAHEVEQLRRINETGNSDRN